MVFIAVWGNLLFMWIVLGKFSENYKTREIFIQKNIKSGQLILCAEGITACGREKCQN